MGRKGKFIRGRPSLVSQIFVPEAFSRGSDNRFVDMAALGPYSAVRSLSFVRSFD
jgi:hypothetical protein